MPPDFFGRRRTPMIADPESPSMEISTMVRVMRGRLYESMLVLK